MSWSFGIGRRKVPWNWSSNNIENDCIWWWDIWFQISHCFYLDQQMYNLFRDEHLLDISPIEAIVSRELLPLSWPLVMLKPIPYLLFIHSYTLLPTDAITNMLYWIFYLVVICICKKYWLCTFALLNISAFQVSYCLALQVCP